ncbi:transposase [Pseudomonadota bacterium]
MLHQVEMVTLEELVPKNHIYRKFKELWNLNDVKKELKKIELQNPTEYVGCGIFRLFLCLLIQFMEDLSDRELEEYLRSNLVSKWFCGFGLVEKTPKNSLFSKVRKRIGTKRLSKIFNILRDQLKSQGYMNEVFTFIDASHLISKANLWEERDKAIKEKYDKLNNKILPKVSKDKQAKIGCKGNNKFWYGYKKHASVDMQSGMINKVAVTPANTIDSKGMKHVTPNQGAVYADKGYCDKNAKKAVAKRNLHLAAIKKNNMKDKDLDRWYSKIRAPYERVFSKTNHRVRYKGIEKNQFTAFMESIVHNLKRLVMLNEIYPPPVNSILSRDYCV